jgi:hypothetical protein
MTTIAIARHYDIAPAIEEALTQLQVAPLITGNSLP